MASKPKVAPYILALAGFLTLPACSYYDQYFNPPPMTKPIPMAQIPPSKGDPDLDARAAVEREAPTYPPSMGDPRSYPNLSTVPARPIFPANDEIAAERTELMNEHFQGETAIAAQAGLPAPVAPNWQPEFRDVPQVNALVKAPTPRNLPATLTVPDNADFGNDQTAPFQDASSASQHPNAGAQAK